MNILLIEDDRKITEALTLAFAAEGYKTIPCRTCADAYSKAAEQFDLMIIDITLPDGNGFELFSELRKYTAAPAIFLTAKDDEDSIVKGFQLGGDDYITKPFSTRELMARIGRFKRDNGSGDTLRSGNIELNYNTHIVTKNGEQTELTALEYKILLMLMQNTGSIVTREALLDRIWDLAGKYVNDNTLTVYIGKLRNKLGQDSIKTIKGIGYKMEEL